MLFGRTALVFLCGVVPVLLEGQVITPANTDFAKSQSAFWTVGRQYEVRFTSTPGCQQLKYTAGGSAVGFSAMPASVVFTATGSEGRLAGVFNSAGSYQFTLRLDCGSNALVSEYQVYVNGPLTMVAGTYLPPCTAATLCTVALTDGGAPAFTGRIVSGSLPTGCSLVGDTLERRQVVGGQLNVSDYHRREYVVCTGYSTTGVSSFQATVTDGFGSTATADFVLTINPPGEFFVPATTMGFVAEPGGAVQKRPLAVGSSDHTAVNFTVLSDAPWLTSSAATGATPASLDISVNPSTLQQGDYVGHLTLNPSGNKKAVTVTVTVKVFAVAPESNDALGVAPETAEVSLWNVLDGAKRYELGFHAWNASGGTLNAQAFAYSQLNWLSVSPAQFSLTAGKMRALAVVVDARSLQPGAYTGSIEIKAGTARRTVPVTLIVPRYQGRPSIRVEKSNLDFGLSSYELQARDGDHAYRIDVFNDDYTTALDFTASLTGFGGHGRLVRPSGHIDAHPADPTVKRAAVIAIIGRELDESGPGRYEGLLEIKAPGALGSPVQAKLVQNIVGALVNGWKKGTAEGAFELRVDNPIMVHHLGEESVAADLKIDNPSDVPVSFNVSPDPALIVDMSKGYIAPNSSRTITATAGKNFTGLAKIVAEIATVAGPDIYVTATECFGAAVTRRDASLSRVQASDECTATRLAIGVSEPLSYFKRFVDTPQRLTAAVYDDCGNPATNASVSASFSSGDGAILLPVSDAAKGIYSGLWTPGKIAADMKITLRASAGTLTGSAEVFGAVLDDPTVPIVFNGGVVSAFNPILAQPASPGTIVAIYGKNLASGTEPAQAVPLPTRLAGTTVLIGGVEAPLFFVSPGQINAYVPAELEEGGVYTVVVKTADRFSTPKNLVIAKLSPGVAAFADGRVIAQHPDYSLITQAAPARPGECIVFYLVGLGLTNPAVPTGAVSPGTTLARVAELPKVTIGGVEARVEFAGLTPGAVGLYQINAWVPDSVASGELPVVITQGSETANRVTIFVAR